jgi:putative ABC transport system permease protein
VTILAAAPALAGLRLGRWGWTLVTLIVLVAATAGLLCVLGVRRSWAPAAAIARAVVQLAVLSLILQGIVTGLRWTCIWLALMLGVAIWTSGRRIGVHGRQWTPVAVGIPMGVAVTLAVVFGLGALDPSPQNVLAYGGIVTGNAMTISTLAGRGFLSRVDAGRGEIEAWLSLGARPRQAMRRFVREAAAAALLPSVDQTKTTGLVTMPGAFVGALFGGSPPLEAGRFQVVVLAGVMCAGAVTALLLLRGLADMPQVPARRPAD